MWIRSGNGDPSEGGVHRNMHLPIDRVDVKSKSPLFYVFL